MVVRGNAGMMSFDRDDAKRIKIAVSQINEFRKYMKEKHGKEKAEEIYELTCRLADEALKAEEENWYVRVS